MEGDSAQFDSEDRVQRLIEEEDLDDIADLPDDALEQVLSAQREIAAANATLAARAEQVTARNKELQELSVDDAVLALASDIEKLDRHRGSCVNHPRDLPLREGEYSKAVIDLL